MVDVLARRIKALAAMTQNAWSISFRVQVKEESSIGNGKTTMEYIEGVL